MTLSVLRGKKIKRYREQRKLQDLRSKVSFKIYELRREHLIDYCNVGLIVVCGLSLELLIFCFKKFLGIMQRIEFHPFLD